MVFIAGWAVRPIRQDYRRPAAHRAQHPHCVVGFADRALGIASNAREPEPGRSRQSAS